MLILRASIPPRTSQVLLLCFPCLALCSGMASSKNSISPSPVVIFLLGACSATVLLVFLFTSTANPAWPPTMVAQGIRQTVATGSGSLRQPCSTAPAPNRKATSAKQRRARARPPKASPPTNARGSTTGAEDEFARMVRRAAMEDGTVIMTSVNEAWAAPGSLLDTFLESFRVGENISHFVPHIIVVAMDEGALRRCHALAHPHCHLLLPDPENSPNGTSPDLSGAKGYMTKDYLALVWSKLRLQQRVLDLGHNLLFTDVDVAWFRDPRVHITAAADITTSSDFYFGDPDDLGNYPNTGFIYFKATARNGRAMAHWHAARRRFPGEHDQFVFNEIKRELAGPGIGVRIRFIDSKDVSGFCQLGRDMNRVATVHTTCCIGLENKLHDLKRVVVDWKRYMARPAWERRAGIVGWTFQGGKCIH